MKKVIKWLDINLEPIFMLGLSLAIILLICTQVILRFTIGAGFAWGEEFATFMFVWCSFIGIAYASRNNRHIGMNYLRMALPEKPRKILMVLVDTGIILLLIVLLQAATKNSMDVIKFNEKAVSMSITMNWLYGAALTGYILIIFRTGQSLLWKIRRFNASIDLFSNDEGVYSFVDDVFFMPEKYRDGFNAKRKPEVVEEAKKYAIL